MSLVSVTLTTERLTLRTPTEADFDAFADWVAGPRSVRFGGPGPRDEAREGFDAMMARWDETGLGYFIVRLTDSGEVIGRIGVSHPAHWPEPEVAYALYEARFEGHGYATEAARRVRDWALRERGLPGLVSYIAPDNAASLALAARLGAWLDGEVTARDGSPRQVWRHWPLPDDGGMEAYA